MGILFADINGFTRICEQVLERPERIGRFVDDWSEEAVRILHRHGGVFDKMVGDCVIGLFGPPFFKDDGTACAGAALKAAIEIQRFTRESMSAHPEISRLSEILQVPGLGVASITLTGLITESAVGTDGAALLAIPFAGAGFVLGGPVVHWAHGNIGRGFGVLGLNIGAPAVTAGLGGLQRLRRWSRYLPESGARRQRRPPRRDDRRRERAISWFEHACRRERAQQGSRVDDPA